MFRHQNKNCQLLTTALLLASLGGSSTSTGTRSRPNIVMIIGDDHGPRDMGYAGSDIQTPNLDDLASQGVKLTNHYVQPTCAPTRNQLLTGRYEVNMGVQLTQYNTCNDGGMPLEFETMADYLKSAGYSTHAVGKWGLGFSHKSYTPLYRGFDTFYGIMPADSDHFTYEHSANGYSSYSLLDGEAPDYAANETFSTFTYTSKAVDVIRNSTQYEEPMFLYLAYTAPHSPLQAPEKYYNKYKNIPNVERRIYAGMVSALDEGVKNVTQALVDEGLWDNTVLIYFADNGGSVNYGGGNWPLRGTKGAWWEGGIKSNAFVTSPLVSKHRRGKANGELVHVTDWVPTVAEIAGIQLNKSLGLDGISQWAMIKDGASAPRTEILHNINETKDLPVPRILNGTFDPRVTASIRVGDYKLLTGEPGDAVWYLIPQEDSENLPTPELDNKTLWLFNIARDPNELDDLSDRMPDKVKEMLDRLLYYDTNAEPAKQLESDLACDPSYKGYWGPWLGQGTWWWGSTTLWLFNIARDPNELSDRMPDKVKEMLDRMLYFDTNAGPAKQLESDPACDPSYKGYWGPWLD